MARFAKLEVPKEGKRIEVKDKKLVIPDNPIVPCIRGDGTGIDISPAAQTVLEAAVQKAYGGSRKIVWLKVYAGDEGLEKYGEVLPKDTLDAVKYYYVAIKGPLTTPVGGGIRSLNVTLRQVLDLYACVRPVRWYKGVPSPVREPWKMNIVVFRENTEDVYAGIEWQKGTKEARQVIEWLNKNMNTKIRTDSGVGIKPVSLRGSTRLIRKAIQYAIDKKRASVTMMHKGNIMKFTEGAFRDWGYSLAEKEFPDAVISEDVLWSKYEGTQPEGKVVLKDRIADSMFQQILTRTDEYEVVATPNLNGDYISDAAAAQVGGLGMAPGANMGDYVGLFEATHGTAPKYAGKDMVNPGSLILSGVMMLRYLKWDKAADLVEEGIERTIEQKTVTYDLARQLEGATKVPTSVFAENIVKNMG